MNVVHGHFGWLRWILAGTVCAALVPATSRARAQTWEYSPYRIFLWVSYGRQGEWDDQELGELTRELDERAERSAGSAWQFIASPPPTEQLRTDLLQDPQSVTFEDVQQAVGEPEPTDLEHLLFGDKLITVSICSQPEGYVVRVRELDIRMQYWGPLVERRTPSRRLVRKLVFDTIAEVFSPLVRIENSEPRKAAARIRAGGLVHRDDSPARVDETSILMPLIRRNDRAGRAKQITVVDWTFLTVEKRDGSLLDCKIHSTWNNPLGGRSSMRVQKVALGVKPIQDHGTLVLKSQGPDIHPLEGYEIYGKDPNSEETELIGVTDWRGQLDIPQVENPLRILYVKNGGMLLARLPMMPGYNLLAEADMPDDQVRLEAEGFIRGMEVELIDLVARRNILASRLHKRIEEGKLDEAQKLLDEFRGMPTSTELLTRIDDRRGGLSTNDRRTRMRVDNLFAKARELVSKHANPRMGEQLTLELTQARNGGSAEASPAQP